MTDDTPELTLEVLSSRVFAVPQDRLFDAFAEADTLAQWWGPHGFTNRVSELDLRPGGAFRISMTNSDGQDFHNHSTFETVERPDLIRFLHHLPMHVFRMEMHFSPTEDGTRLTWRMLFEKNAENLALKKFIVAANEQNFDRLEAVLSSAQKGE